MTTKFTVSLILVLVALLAGCAPLPAPVITSAPTATPSAGVPASGATGPDAPALVGNTWQWEKQVNPSSGQESAIDNSAGYTLTFAADGSYQFQADCSSGSGSYVADEKGGIRLNPGPMTMAACGETSRDQDMLNMMQAVQDYRMEEDGAVLVMIWPAGGPEDVYRAQ